MLPVGFVKTENFIAEIFSFFLSAGAPLSPIVSKALDLWFWLSLPVLAMAGLGAMVGNVMQFGFLFTTEPLKADIKKIDPFAGVKRLFAADRAIELFKQLIKFVVIFWVIASTIKDQISNLLLLFRLTTVAALALVGEILWNIVARVLICFFIIAIFDFFWQRFSFLKSMRMSKYEIKKEYKSQEGDPQLKHERKRMHQEVLESSAIDLKDATVVVTNPAHVAAVLSFDAEKDPAPKLIAKGVGKLAEEIMERAKKSDVPIIRNVPLARDLQWLDINETIPENMYDSVAEVLTFIYELNQREEIS